LIQPPTRVKLRRQEVAMAKGGPTIHCGHCRARFKQDLSLWVQGDTYYRNVSAVQRDHLGRIICECLRCHHRWPSKSPEAVRLLARAMAPKPEPVKRRPVAPIKNSGQMSLI
jgi:hypothetical protein